MHFFAQKLNFLSEKLKKILKSNFPLKIGFFFLPVFGFQKFSLQKIHFFAILTKFSYFFLRIVD
jgi:hypothetical protein